MKMFYIEWIIEIGLYTWNSPLLYKELRCKFMLSLKTECLTYTTFVICPVSCILRMPACLPLAKNYKALSFIVINKNIKKMHVEVEAKYLKLTNFCVDFDVVVVMYCFFSPSHKLVNLQRILSSWLWNCNHSSVLHTYFGYSFTDLYNTVWNNYAKLDSTLVGRTSAGNCNASA